MHRPQAVLCDVALLLFLLFAANYQPPISCSRQKSWVAGGAAIGKTARSPAVLPLFSAVFVAAML